jgi:hypothetical protein
MMECTSQKVAIAMQSICTLLFLSLSTLLYSALVRGGGVAPGPAPDTSLLPSSSHLPQINLTELSGFLSYIKHETERGKTTEKHVGNETKIFLPRMSPLISVRQSPEEKRLFYPFSFLLTSTKSSKMCESLISS